MSDDDDDDMSRGNERRMTMNPIRAAQLEMGRCGADKEKTKKDVKVCFFVFLPNRETETEKQHTANDSSENCVHETIAEYAEKKSAK